MLEQVTAIGRGAYVSRQAYVFLTRYLVEGVKHKPTRELLAPYLLEILTCVILPLCCFTPALHEQWREDPMEVIRKNSSALTAYDTEDIYDVRDASVHVLLEVMRAKPLCAALLEPFMEKVVGIAAEFRSQHGARFQAVARIVALCCAALYHEGRKLTCSASPSGCTTL